MIMKYYFKPSGNYFMKNLLKYFGYACVTGVAVVSLFMVNLFLMKPFSIDQFLAKELVVGLVGSPDLSNRLFKLKQLDASETTISNSIRSFW